MTVLRLMVGVGVGLWSGPVASVSGMGAVQGAVFSMGIVLTILASIDLVRNR